MPRMSKHRAELEYLAKQVIAWMSHAGQKDTYLPTVEMLIADAKDVGQPPKPKEKPKGNPDVLIVKKELIDLFTRKMGEPPVFSHAVISKQIKSLLSVDKFSANDLIDIIDWYIMSPKFKEHPTPSASLSKDTIQRYLIANPR